MINLLVKELPPKLEKVCHELACRRVNGAGNGPSTMSWSGPKKSWVESLSLKYSIDPLCNGHGTTIRYYYYY
jgi:hypothetical protein